MPTQIYGTPKPSPDVKRLVIVVQELRSDVYIYDIAKNNRIRLTMEGNNNNPIWTPNGESVTFVHRMVGEGYSIFRTPSDGSGGSELLYASQHDIVPLSWLPDGKQLPSYPSSTKMHYWL